MGLAASTYPGFTVVGQTTQADHGDARGRATSGSCCSPWTSIHGFYIHDFNFSRYALPGVVNQFTFDAQQTGTFFGQCTQLCGLYHSLMWFQVKVVTPPQYAAWLKQNQAAAAASPPTRARHRGRQQLNPDIPVQPYLGGGMN